MFSKLKNRFAAYGPLTAGLVIITLVTTLGGLWHYQYELAHQASTGKPMSARAEAVKDPYSNPDNPAAVTDENRGQSSDTRESTSATSNSSAQAPVKTTAAGKAAPKPGAKPAPASAAQSSALVSVALNVNGAGKGSVRLATGSNQCEVLSQALKNGQISSLDMRYSSQYRTQAVYVIDGIGDPGTVWWTYKVNGSAPPYGCSNTPARNGDSVNWQYAKR